MEGNGLKLWSNVHLWGLVGNGGKSCRMVWNAGEWFGMVGNGEELFGLDRMVCN